ncbi:23S rRNA (adenine1618-N6)-methyltransferase [Geosmithia morbida]|uniref:23S rRNA (Adenine1618-N6)-methyltransferase n=1 Tax=Geosmithia morbida TaxID=1094350 RepID=A0A9P5D8E4_9HYPO|nr:23S rRNA (adenine1618-N6)-methyltransferase [Geosmithia morbida]KAF4125434.1 23S rRNA (adenine1618-N6)-methyltransferase [Geosmithia morbida]
MKRKHADSLSSKPHDEITIRGDIDSAETRVATDKRFESLYVKSRDFKDLAVLDADFAAVVKGRHLDFEDARAVKQLTKTLLRLDFGLVIDLPDDRLCPPRPWSFIATDIDEKNITYARKNIHLNNLDSRITVLRRQPDDTLIPATSTSIDFCMTNPPFYESESDMATRAAQKSRPPSTACTGHPVEMVTRGGEVAFVNRIVTESLTLRTSVAWYTAMLGFLSSVTAVLSRLRDLGVDNVAVTEFVQGSKTRRWAVAWSFRPMRPAQAVARGTNSIDDRSLLPPHTEAHRLVVVPLSDGILASLPGALEEVLGQLDLVSWSWDKHKLQGTGRAVGNVWNRAWRRRQRQMQRTADVTDDDPDEIGFGFSVSIHVGRDDVSVDCRWLEGHNPVIFESFQAFLKTTVESLAKR